MRINKPGVRLIKRIRRYFLITGLLYIVLVILFEIQVAPFSEKCSVKQAKAISNNIVNNAVCEVIDELGYSYDDLAVINYSQNSDVKSITTLSSNINKIKSSVLLKIQKELDKNKMHSFYLPLGSFTQLTMLNNIGPDIEVNFRMTGSAKCKIKSSFESSGLNQTVHHIYLVVTTNVIVLSPEFSAEKVYKSDYEIAQTVVVGGLPSTYAGIDRQ